MHVAQDLTCYTCGHSELDLAFRYDAPPAGETRFSFSEAASYCREVFRCPMCGHFLSVHDMDDSQLYSQDYVGSTYGDDGLRRTFERIISLDPTRSDNAGRCARIQAFCDEFLPASRLAPSPRTVLDVGSGLCVFLHRMKSYGWEGTAIDPDPRAVAHACQRVGVHGWCGDFLAAPPLGPFHLVTFNKVLEHVPDPVRMLARSRAYVAPGGFVYVELPDGECASRAGAGREEFFIEHHHVFSLASLALLAARAGFTVCTIERLQEPSTKYTLRAFLVPMDRGEPK